MTGEIARLKRQVCSRVADILRHEFKNQDLIVEALTHSSAKELGLPCNERLEFLGDAILGHIVSEYLFKKFPHHEEGDLSVIKSVLVSSKFLSRAAKKLKFDELILTGKGISDHKLPASILANTFEAVIAALYLDAGFEKAREFVMSNLINDAIKDILQNQYERNYKSILQDYAQKHALALPTYKVTREAGPDHRKRFQVVVEVNGHEYGPTWGYSKKEAEQKAARYALVMLGVLREPLPQTEPG